MRFVFVCVAALAASPALAAELPAVDVDAFCAKASKGEPRGQAACVRQEQVNYEYALAFWPDLSAARQTNCVNMMRKTDGAEYLLLASCVRSELGFQQVERDRASPPRFRP